MNSSKSNMNIKQKDQNSSRMNNENPTTEKAKKNEQTLEEAIMA